MKQKNTQPAAVVGGLAILAAILGGAWLVNYVASATGRPPIDPGIAVIAATVAIVLLLIIICSAAGEKGAQGCLSFLFFLIGFPGFSNGWWKAWWKRLLDVLANLIWLGLVTVATLICIYDQTGTRPKWWQIWLGVLVPMILVRLIRFVIVFIVDGVGKQMEVEITAAEAQARLLGPVEKDATPRPRGPVQFLPAKRRPIIP